MPFTARSRFSRLTFWRNTIWFSQRLLQKRSEEFWVHRLTYECQHAGLLANYHFLPCGRFLYRLQFKLLLWQDRRVFYLEYFVQVHANCSSFCVRRGNLARVINFLLLTTSETNNSSFVQVSKINTFLQSTDKFIHYLSGLN